MNDEPQRGRIRLPKVLYVELRGFSLYRNLSTIRAEFGDGVFCLAGANGLGKSTFLAAVNFGLTGIAADPERSFRSVEEYYRHSIGYSESHFDGRIAERDRELAEIEVRLDLAGHGYRLVRSMFEPRALRELNVWPLARGEEIDAPTGAETSGDLHEVYEKCLVEHSGLKSFDQFVFLQHFLFTFDERRHLIFWDERVASQAFYLAFGLDPSAARRADQLARQEERFESQARNLQYQATTARQRLEELVAKAGELDGKTADLSEEHRSLVEAADVKEGEMRAAFNRLRDAELGLSIGVAEEAAARRDFEEAFKASARGGRSGSPHPVARESLDTGQCQLCGSTAVEAMARLRELVEEGACTLCGTDLPTISDEVFEELRLVDERLAEARSRVRDATAQAERLKEAYSVAERAAEEARRKVREFELNNEALVSMGGTGKAAGVLDGLEKQFRAEIEDALRRKKEFRRKRDQARAELAEIRDVLTEAYALGETEFVPLFRSLAGDFLGLDLDLNLDFDSSGGTELVLTLEGTKRRAMDQLSESQRYFVDIALRMALAQYMCHTQDTTALYIDTPEGSLDIAYESRAGRMFGRFVKAGYRVVMTANINTSRLLLELAEVCGKDDMELMRMTEWTSLSDVQAEAESLFDNAYSKIEEALERGGN